MAISKSRLGRGLGNLIAGGISNSPQPTKPAAKQAATPAPKPIPASGKNKPQAQKKSVPAPKPVSAKPAPAKPVAKPAAKPVPAKQAPKPASKPTPAKSKAQPVKPTPLAKPAPAVKTVAAKPVATKPEPRTATAAASSQKAASATVIPSTSSTAAQSPAPAATVAGSAAAAPVAAVPTASKPAAAAAATISDQSTSTTATSQTQQAVAQQQASAATPATAQPQPAQQSAQQPTQQNSGSTGNATHATGSAVHSTGGSSNSGSHAGNESSGKPTAVTATAAAEATTAGNNPYREIPVNAVVPNPYQPRREMSAEHIAELADSIASEGLLQPIVVRPLDGGKGYELIAGERRWRAHQKLGLRVIAARVMNASDSSSAVISLIENIQRQALNPIEEALGFASLMRDFDLTQEAVSERIGRARASIANTLRLLALDREIQGYVAKGILSVGHAKILLGLEEPAQRLLIARRIIESGLSVRETEALVQRLKNEKHSRGNGGTSAVSEADRTAIADLEKQLSSKLNTRVFLKHAPKKGRIVIEYHGNEDLQRILERTGLQL